jgi:hypothetical protein
MKKSTKRILLGVGGALLGIAAAGTGGILVGGGIAGLLLRTGVVKAAPGVSKEMLKAVTSTSTIVTGIVGGTSTIAAAMKLSIDSGATIDEALYERRLEKEEKVVIKVTEADDGSGDIIIEAQAVEAR